MTKRVVLIGHPVAHSLSGAMQQAAFDSLGIDVAYELWDRAPVELAEAVKTMAGYTARHALTIAVMGCRVNGPGETDDARQVYRSYETRNPFDHRRQALRRRPRYPIQTWCRRSSRNG